MYYPVYLNLKGKRCLVVGGGSVALRKVSGLLKAQAKVKVVSPDAAVRLKKLAKAGRIELALRHYRSGELKKSMLVIGATDDERVNRRIFNDAQNKGILVNIVDNPKYCNFIVPSVLRRGDLCISISTGGVSPALAKNIRKELEKSYGRWFNGYLKVLSSWRKKVVKNIKDERLRRRLLIKLASPGLLIPVRRGKLKEVKSKLTGIIGPYLKKE